MSDDPLIAGLDVGTGSVKAMVFDPRGGVMSSSSVPTPTRRPRAGWAEHDPQELWSAAAEALREAVGQLDEPARVASVAVASMAEAGVPLDAHGEPVADVIAWFDRRSVEQGRQLEEAVGADRLAEVAGLRPQPIYGLCKLMWLEQNEPDAYSRMRAWLNVADFVAFRLCGEQATDFSLATRTAALDLRELCWSEELLSGTAVSHSLMPPLSWSGTRLGTLTREAAEETGLHTDAVVATGGHDHICGALAAGVLDPGRALDSMGTAESILVPLTELADPAEPAQQGHSCGAHVVRDRYYISGGVHAAGASVDWVLELAGGERDERLTEASAVPPGAHGASFLPLLRAEAGEVVERGVLMGLTPELGRAELVRAVHEGLAFAFRHALDAVASHAGLDEPPEVRAIGGGARNQLLLELKATVLGRPLHRLEVEEATCLGAALLGAVGADLYEDAAKAAVGLELEAEEIHPHSDQVAGYQARFEELLGRDYPDLRAVSRALEELADEA
ncbi:MAG: FGGY family carbohydrate kinase [Actinomycetota bacterium]|nr:FGGY family carbohydrate kinase [Actinomycetota bacterium]